MDDIIELRQLLGVIRRQIWLILTVTVVFTLAAGVGSQYLLRPQYQATTEILLNSTGQVGGNTSPMVDAQATSAQITSNLLLIETFRTVIMSPRVMEPVSQQVQTPMNNLIKEVSVDNVKDSQVISIIVKDQNAGKAVQIANTVATVFQSQISQLMKIDNVNVLTPAKDTEQVWPRPVLTGAIGFVLGLILSIGFVLMREYLDTRLRTRQQVEKYLGLPLIGTVPVISKKAKKAAAQVNKLQNVQNVSAGGEAT